LTLLQHNKCIGVAFLQSSTKSTQVQTFWWLVTWMWPEDTAMHPDLVPGEILYPIQLYIYQTF